MTSDLEALRERRVYFGHQSVGRNILDGLAAMAPQADLAFLTESEIGENGNPQSKCDDFARHVEGLDGHIDIALMKFCYIDFDQNSDVEQIFGHYSQTIDRLQQRYPQIRFVHVTAPLKTSPSGLKTLVKKLLGRTNTAALQANLKRCQFNNLLRKKYQGQPIFDLAALQSTDRHGRQHAFTLGSQTGFSMVHDYTSDGGHLNQAGSQMAARALVRTLAAAMRSRTEAGARQ